MTEKVLPELPPGIPHDPTLSFVPRKDGPEAATLGSPGCLVTWSTSAPSSGAGGDEEAAPDANSAPAFYLHRVLGRGGMGEVWEATQSSLGRLVAVKRVLAKGDGNDKGRLREFRQEAVIAGRLEHPNIVPVHDLGLDERGAPLLAMKLVKGRPWDLTLTEDFATLSADDLLAKNLPVLMAVGHAVAFAHSQGIVHRDIKPGQVMTGEFGEALLMDWGLAIQVSSPPGVSLPVDQSQLVATPETATNPAGTVALMANEQTAEDASRIGPWTDVFLLGGTLYFLLTGTYPHAGVTAREAFAKAVEGAIENPRERAPHRPMPEELVDLCLRALRKEPEARVESAKAFVQGIQDYLGGSSKRRESKALVESATSLLAQAPRVYGEFIRITEMIERAIALWPDNPAASPALDGANAGHAQAALLNGDLVLGRSMAERVQDRTRRAALLAETDRLETLARAQVRQRRFLVATSFGLLLVIIVGGGIFALKLDEQRKLAEANAVRADQRAREAKESRGQADGLVRFMITDLSDKLAPIDADLAALEEAATRAADYYTNQSMHPERLDSDERYSTVSSLLAVSGVLAKQGEAARALETTRRAMEFSEKLEGPGALAARAGSTVSYGQELRRGGKLNEAAAAFDRAVKIAEPEGDGRAALPYARALLCRADLLLVQGHTEEGAADCIRGVAILDKLVVANPSDASALMQYTWGAFKLVTVYASSGRIKEALAELRAIRERADKLLQVVPGSDGVLSELSSAWTREGELLQSTGELDQALDATQHAIAISQEQAARMPTNVAVLSDVAYGITRRGTILSDLGRFDEAITDIKKGLAIREDLCRKDPENMELVVRFRGGWQRLAETYTAAGRLEDAAQAREQALAASRILYTSDPSQAYVVGVALELCSLADIRLRLEDATKARDLARESLDMLKKVGTGGPRIGDTSLSAHIVLASALDKLEDPGAGKAFEDALAQYERFPRLDTSSGALYAKSTILIRLGRRDEAKAAAVQAKKAGLNTPEFAAFLKEEGFDEE